MQNDNGTIVTEKLMKIMEKNEQMLARFQNRLKQSEFIERPNPRLIRTAGQHITWYSDQLMVLQTQLRELERLYGGSVKLRTTEEHDLRRIWRWSNEPTLREALRTELTTFQAYVDGWHHWLADEEMQPFSIDRPGDELIGFMLIKRTAAAETRNASLEFIIIHPDYRYRGYGTEAVKCAIAFAFEQFGADVFTLQVDADNDSAVHCFEKSGLKYINMESVSSSEGGVSSDRYQMELRREDWRSADSTPAEFTGEPESDVDAAAANVYAGGALLVPLRDLISN
jgi:RimJ/RimL family protein N-acetyltransferase